MDGEYWQRDDLLARLRMEASINQGNAKLCGEAADEIERLRLTESEREAVQQAFDFVCEMQRPDEWAVAALRGLLERTTL